jgi:hypothetical protein
MLTTDTAALYLLERGLLEARSVVEGDVLVLDSSRRNSNFRIISRRAPSYLIKQGFGTSRVAGIANESAIYRLLQLQAGLQPGLDRYLPVLRFHDSEEHLLITDLLPDGQNLAEHQLRTGRFSTKIAGMIGKALSILHSTRIPPEANGHAPQLTLPPWVLSAQHVTVDLYRQLSNANLQLVSTLQRIPGAGARLDHLRSEWKQSCLIHYDLKLENIVVAGSNADHTSTHRVTRLKLVDWELAGIGDPLWDVGSIMGEYLAAWLLSIPVTGSHPPDRFLELARYPLSAIQPATRSLWRAYIRRRTTDNSSQAHRRHDADNPQSSWPVRVASYAAARLIQTAFERSQTASVLTGEALCLLQVGINILERPQEAAIHLLGIPPSAPWHIPHPNPSPAQ